MGRNNQKRRAEKKRRSGTSPGPGGSAGKGGSWWSARPPGGGGAELEMVILAAALAAAEGNRHAIGGAVAGLVRQAETVGPRQVTDRVAAVFSSSLATAWGGGWQPVEVVHQVRRRGRGRHGELLLSALATARSYGGVDIGAMPDAWRAQLAEVGVFAVAPSPTDWIGGWRVHAGLALSEALTVALETIAVLVALPEIAEILPPPGAWATLGPFQSRVAPDDPVLARVRALLAKAESTGFEAEANAFTAKAQELMARHAIDDALARSRRPTEERPVNRRLTIDDPYASAKSNLLHVVAQANGVRTVWHESLAIMTIIGFEADLDAVAVLFTSLLVQGSRAMLAKGSVSDGRGRSRTRSFRQSFLLAFASRIRERLAMAAFAARQAAEEELATSLLPVLAGRDEQVDEAVSALFPRLRFMSGPSVTNEAGWRAGRTAAELATLGPERHLLSDATATG